MPDVSYAAAVTGLIQTAVEGIKEVLNALSTNPRMRVGIITYDSAVQVYSLQAGKEQPSMMVVGDVDDVFVPCPPDEICVRVSDPDFRAQLDSLLDLIPTAYQVYFLLFLKN